MLRLSCAFILPWRESLGGGATCDGHHPFIRLRDTGGAHSTRLKGDAHLQGCAAGACSTCHDGLLAPVARARQGATPWAAVPRETHPHTWGAVVCVECSSSTLPKSWQLCRKCSEPPPGQHIPRCNGQVYGIQVPATLRIPTEKEKRTGKRQFPLRPLRR